MFCGQQCLSTGIIHTFGSFLLPGSVLWCSSRTSRRIWKNWENPPFSLSVSMVLWYGILCHKESEQSKLNFPSWMVFTFSSPLPTSFHASAADVFPHLPPLLSHSASFPSSSSSHFRSCPGVVPFKLQFDVYASKDMLYPCLTFSLYVPFILLLQATILIHQFGEVNINWVQEYK